MKLSARLPRTLSAMALAMSILAAGPHVAGATSPKPGRYLSPTALAVTKNGETLFVACATANRVLFLDTATKRVFASTAVPNPPSGLALSPDGTVLYITCAAPESQVCIVNVAKRLVVKTLAAGHTAMAPVLSTDGKTLYVCNRFDNDVSVIDLAARKVVRHIRVQREPVAADLTKDGKLLLVANHLHSGRADVDTVASVVSVIDLAAGKVIKELQLPSGSGSLNDIRVSPDGKYAVVTHIYARFDRPTAHIYRGWMNANAKTVIDLSRMEIYNTVSLDDPRSGAANPWAIAWAADNAKVILTHAGTHEVSVIDFPRLMARLPRFSAKLTRVAREDIVYTPGSAAHAELAKRLPFITVARQRVKLPEMDRGPRAVVVVGHTAYVANYFSDTLSAVDLSDPSPRAESISLGPKPKMDVVRQGECYFHDASICFQGWQSCSSCHPGDARADGLNWDLLNDGTGNPKNTRSLLFAHRTPPAMALGVRDTAETAVRAGIRHILFTQQPDTIAVAMDEYLKSLKLVPSPYLVHGKPSKAAERGKKVFSRAGCAACHPPPLFTDLNSYDVGTTNRFDKPSETFDTPTLVEIWRTAPYLHDGSAATIRDVLTTRNSQNRHGNTSNLSSQQIDDLCAYLLSL